MGGAFEFGAGSPRKPIQRLSDSHDRGPLLLDPSTWAWTSLDGSIGFSNTASYLLTRQPGWTETGPSMPLLTAAAAAQAIRADLRAVKRGLKAAVAAEQHAEALRLRAEEGRLRDEYQRLIWEVVQREERALRPSYTFDH
jgi:TRAP-type mannitol/chloroaromatic compound transport system substrate-binding protein